MKASDNTVNVHFDIDPENAEIHIERLEEVVRFICEKFDAGPATVEIQVVDDAGISAVHEQFLDDAAVTDVISFDLTDDFEEQQSFQLVVNAQLAQRKAEELGHSTDAELALYIVHGMLHNLGFDDRDEQEAKRMHQTEDALLQELGFGIIYHRDERI